MKESVFGEWIQSQTTQADACDAMELELRDFINCIRTGVAPRVTGGDAVDALVVADQVLEGLQAWSYQTNSIATRRRHAA